MSCNFHVGQKVVCIENSSRTVNDLGLPGYKKGQVLTISRMEMSNVDGFLASEELFLSFVERDPRSSAHHSGFRPVAKRKTDISIFKAMLNPSKQRADA